MVENENIADEIVQDVIYHLHFATYGDQFMGDVFDLLMSRFQTQPNFSRQNLCTFLVESPGQVVMGGDS